MNVALRPGDIVLVSLHSPKEKLWGVLLSAGPEGLVLRGLDLAAFEDWLHQEARGEERLIVPSTVFFPMNRVERMERDETLGAVASLSDRFRAKVGQEPAAALGYERPSARRPGTRRPRARRA